MQHTLVAVFDNRTDAQNALNELLSSGFSSEDARLANADAATDSLGADASLASDRDSDTGFGASIKNFFSDLFGSDNADHVSRYEGAVSSGRHVLTLTADSLPEVERAADIVERYGPTDIDEQASGFGEVPGSAAAMPMGMSSGMQKSAPMSAQSASTSLEDAGDRKLYQQQSLNQAEPMGGTYQEPMGKSGLTATGGTSLQGSTLQENSVQGSSLEGTQKSGVGLGSSAQQGGTLRGASQQTGTLQGSALEGSIREDSQQRAELRDTDDSLLKGSRMGADMRDSASIPVVEEHLQVGKREVQRGGVRIYSRVVETPVDETIGLREEHVNVERHRVDRPVNPADLAAFKEQTIEMRETAEEAVVQKSARIVEEVTIGKQVNERQQKIHDTVRHTEVDVQQLGAGMGRSTLGDDDSDYRKHFRSTYGATGASYDDYVPAYSYGSQMRRDARYGSRQWDDVETDLRTDWETRNAGGPSTWDKMKAAVRRGWDRMTDDDDSYYRSHFQSTYGGSGELYDDYAPAYSYGSQMRRDTRYSGRKWDEIENDLHADWDTRNSGGPSTWERMKSAVRRGWDRMTDDDDDYYRNHYSSTYATSGRSYDDYKPAYSYGSDMARSENYRNRPWDDVETDLRSGWDTRYGSSGTTGSAWQDMKDAVKHGWNRMTDDDDTYYRSHWNATYSSAGDSYDTYRPAYSYGSQMASSDKYRGRPWNDVENDLRTDWETRNAGGPSTWEKMKAAVRHGWDRMTS
ncbi:DUF2382 domain-containing protein [Massilia niastensis]|uniref:DUF2382 domain-containing protein n=1 Tax=Massilia niastensis TaxID=544911 RepID=UPI00039A8E3B|nr:DUF2382 domain-containing protein [Massilia niastensis]